jgi:hypothetical protein
VAGTPKERDWDKEMAEVDRLLKKLPEADPSLGRSGGSAATVKKPAVAPSTPAGFDDLRGGGQWIGTWTRVVLGLLIGIGMTQWPYTHGCGLKFIFYMIGVFAVLAAGCWSSISSWKRRLGVAHVLAQGLIIWGLVLAAREILPRIGYAKVPAPWLCPDGAPGHTTD